MVGLVPTIHVVIAASASVVDGLKVQDVDGRHKADHDEVRDVNGRVRPCGVRALHAFVEGP
jgi:hypothetical protein